MKFCYIFICISCLKILLIASIAGKDIANHEGVTNSDLACIGGTFLSSSVCIPKFYRKADIPNTPTVVNTSLQLKNIRERNDKTMTITVDIIFSFYWIDNRIKTKFSDKEKAQGRTNLEVHQLQEIWKPDIYVYNLSNFNSHSVKEPLGGLSILSKIYWEQSNGNATLNYTLVEYWFEAEATIYCSFYYQQYPMDIQQCEFRITSSNFGKNLIFKLFYKEVNFSTAGDNAVRDFDMDIKFFDTSGKNRLK